MSADRLHKPTATLDGLRAGEQGRIAALTGTPDVRRRLMEMGLIPGTTLRVVRFAPLGDPMDIEVRGYHLSLRKQEARQVLLSEPRTPANGPAN